MTGQRIGLLKTLGPATERQLAETAIADEAALRALGAVEAWRRLKFRFPREMTPSASTPWKGRSATATGMRCRRT